MTGGPRGIPPASGSRRRSRVVGFTLVEVIMVLTFMGILLSVSAPTFHRVVEQSRADMAAVNLQAVWAAQRYYWLENRAYAGDLGALGELIGADNTLSDPSVVVNTPYYTFTVDPAVTSLGTSFRVSATRNPGSDWSGAFSIDQTGVVSGRISSPGEPDITTR